jgi:hypothetical protein
LTITNTYTHIKGYIRVRGYWDEGLEWTAWLIESAKQAGDLAFAVEVMSDRARTLIDMRSPVTMEEAGGILQAPWDLRHQQTGKFQLELVTNLVILLVAVGVLENVGMPNPIDFWSGN